MDANYPYQGIGSKEQPFNKISQAVEAGSKNIHVANGIYEENIYFENINIIGENREKTIIKGEILINGDSRLENISVILEKKSGDSWYLNSHLKDAFGVWIGNGANVTIKNVLVSGGKIGIEANGKGQFNLENSIITKNAKGVYVKKGRDAKIINSDISDNYEEGIDLRDDVRVTIENNKINNNDLSGIEAVLGYSEVSILNNKILGNGNSGITFQYYKSADAIGKFKINNNEILENNKYAITCNRPMGGSPGGRYWSDSIVEMKDNTMYSNGELSFASGCKFSDETKFNALKEADNLDGQIERGHFKFFTDEVDRQIMQTAVQNRSKIKTFLIGSDYKKLEDLEGKIVGYKEHISKLDNFSKQTESQEIIEMINEDKEDIQKLNKSIEEFVTKERNRFSLFGGLFN